ncbi:MAG: hypothetical protein JJD92_06855 [Frankiaceae bacterium]|nr:hypothetical protein [Frankiaceae bacterium]
MDTKRCVTCHEVKPISSFNFRRAARDGRQARCRDCSRTWYLENREEHRQNVARRNKLVRKEYRERLVAYLKAHPCVDCGESDLRVLDFDHRDSSQKLETVGRVVGLRASWKRIQAEIDKCDIRCANCHRRRTAEDYGWWRHIAQIADEEADDDLAS